MSVVLIAAINKGLRDEATINSGGGMTGIQDILAGIELILGCGYRLGGFIPGFNRLEAKYATTIPV